MTIATTKLHRQSRKNCRFHFDCYWRLLLLLVFNVVRIRETTVRFHHFIITIIFFAAIR